MADLVHANQAVAQAKGSSALAEAVIQAEIRAARCEMAAPQGVAAEPPTGPHARRR